MSSMARSQRTWKRRVLTGAIMVATALIGVVVAQTFPGTASPGAPFEVHGLLYSGSAPAGFQLGDGWAQGASFRGVLDANGLPALDAGGTAFRAAHMVDPNWGNQGDGFDPTLFGGGNKNLDLIGLGQSPWDWGGGGGSPQKNDITNCYFHTRVDPLTGDRWVFVAAETRSISGDSHVDFEFNQAGVITTGTTSGLIVGLGPDGGRTINDFLINVDFEQGGTHPVASIRFWDGAQFILVDVPDSMFSATNLLDIPHGAGGTWKHFTTDGAMVNVLTHRQLVEGAANLSALGVDVDACNTDATFTAKTRSSSSWTADLKDFAIVRFPLEPAPDLEITAPQASCSESGFQASVVDYSGLPNLSFLWSVSGCGQIVGDATGNTVNIAADPVCGCVMELSVTASGGECGHVAWESVSIAVGDDSDPVLSQEPADQTVECDAVPAPVTVTATDDCGPVDVVFEEDNQPGQCLGEATILRTWSAADDCANSDVHVQVIDVQDNSAPTLQGVPQDASASCDAIPAPAEVTASDNCSQAFVELADVFMPGRCDGEATVSRTWIALDECGNEASQTQTITVTDQAAPQLSGVPADTMVECDAVPASADVSATDNCSTPIVVLDETTIDGDCEGEWTVSRQWSATDDCGNASSGTQIIDVIDSMPPQLFGVPADGVVECSGIPNPPTVTATDNCSEPTIELIEDVVPGPTVGTATITRTWIATDACGNETSQNQILDVVDTSDPTLQGVPADITVECDAIPTPPNVTATDNCATPTVTLRETTQPGDCDGRWTIIRTWTATDAVGNEVSQTQVIHVADTKPPSFGELPADATVECDAVPEPANVTATDTCSVANVDLDETAEPGDCEGRSTITRRWTATDDCGNQSAHVQVLTVVDTTSPQLSGDPQDITAECDSIPRAPTLSASDNCDPSISVAFAEKEVPGDCEGESTIFRSWSTEDDCGNPASVDQVVTVQDTKAPVITFTGGVDYICQSGPAVFTARASDNCSDVGLSLARLTAITANSRDQIIAAVQPDGSIKITAPGPAYIMGEFAATDDCGNASAPFRFTAEARLGREACSQGFWKNHVDRWGPTGFTPSMLFVDAFGITDLSSPEIPGNFDPGITFFEAANMTGGSFNQALLQGSAALLNAAHPDVDYPLTVSQVRSAMQNAFAGVITFEQARAFFNTGQAVESQCGCPVQ